MQRCLGWPAPHVPSLVLSGTDDGGPVSDGICAACDAVFAITQARPSTPRLARFVTRLEYDLDCKALSGSVWSARDRQLRMEKLHG